MKQKNKIIIAVLILIDIFYVLFLWNYKLIEQKYILEPFKLFFFPMVFYFIGKETLFKESKNILIRGYNLLFSFGLIIVGPLLLFNEVNFSNIILFALPFSVILVYLFLEKIKEGTVFFIFKTLSLFEARKSNVFNFIDIIYSILIMILIFAWFLLGYASSDLK